MNDKKHKNILCQTPAQKIRIFDQFGVFWRSKLTNAPGNIEKHKMPTPAMDAPSLTYLESSDKIDTNIKKNNFHNINNKFKLDLLGHIKNVFKNSFLLLRHDLTHGK